MKKIKLHIYNKFMTYFLVKCTRCTYCFYARCISACYKMCSKFWFSCLVLLDINNTFACDLSYYLAKRLSDLLYLAHYYHQLAHNLFVFLIKHGFLNLSCKWGFSKSKASSEMKSVLFIASFFALKKK